MCEQRGRQCEQRAYGVTQWRNALSQQFTLWLARSQTRQFSPAEQLEWIVMVAPFQLPISPLL